MQEFKFRVSKIHEKHSTLIIGAGKTSTASRRIYSSGKFVTFCS